MLYLLILLLSSTARRLCCCSVFVKCHFYGQKCIAAVRKNTFRNTVCGRTNIFEIDCGAVHVLRITNRRNHFVRCINNRPNAENCSETAVSPASSRPPFGRKCHRRVTTTTTTILFSLFARPQSISNVVTVFYSSLFRFPSLRRYAHNAIGRGRLPALWFLLV